MLLKKALFEMPVPSTNSVTDANLLVFGNAPTLRFDYYRNGIAYRSGIRFKNALSTQTRNERSCTAWHIEGAYDTLVEVIPSSWISKLLEDVPDRWKGEIQKMHHYMIYLDSAGCFEIVAESYEVLPESEGSWSKSCQI